MGSVYVLVFWLMRLDQPSVAFKREKNGFLFIKAINTVHVQMFTDETVCSRCAPFNIVFPRFHLPHSNAATSFYVLRNCKSCFFKTISLNRKKGS